MAHDCIVWYKYAHEKSSRKPRSARTPGPNTTLGGLVRVVMRQDFGISEDKVLLDPPFALTFKRANDPQRYTFANENERVYNNEVLIAYRLPRQQKRRSS